ncbi:MAG TPA: bifunctional diaminohydroxyphosphoribosylaminopyrimidine deaminase/5-amino-6-(5-phosphoribosylamino)uracil reductase RibD [Acidimicrobiales bacterium]|nr:bifunctional diaminohydroxyphosphoribosylaminopyrimidine deaminase/5-amino-6-(5-phosphoribosylamino)uracil reductase RibD [Acidimicrobiales bacterium]
MTLTPTLPGMVASLDTDHQHMLRAIELAAGVRTTTSPNPWVGCVLVTADGREIEGATRPPGGPHAEAAALAEAAAGGLDTRGATAYVTLEPCCHHGRTPPCADALIAAGVARVVVGIEDPDPQVRGQGIARLTAAGVGVSTGVAADVITEQLAPYLTHRTTGRPYVVLKLAASLDGRTAAPNGTSRWITGEAARADAHRLRAESDAVLVGAGTIRADDPALTVRHVAGRDPLRVVLGKAPPDAKVHPAVELEGDLGEVLDELGRRDVVQLLVEGGATVAGAFHRAGLVDRYVVYLAPVLFGGDDARGLFTGPAAVTMADVWRGRIGAVTQWGDDIRVDLYPSHRSH